MVVVVGVVVVVLEVVGRDVNSGQRRPRRKLYKLLTNGAAKERKSTVLAQGHYYSDGLSMLLTAFRPAPRWATGCWEAFHTWARNEQQGGQATSAQKKASRGREGWGPGRNAALVIRG